MKRLTARTWVSGMLLAAGFLLTSDSVNAGNFYKSGRSYYVSPPIGAYGPDYAPPPSRVYDPPIAGPNPSMGTLYENPAYYSYGNAREHWGYSPNHSRYDYGVHYLGGRGYGYHYERHGNHIRTRESFGR